MKRGALILIGVTAASQHALAQNSTTNCSKDYFGNVTCQTQADPRIEWERLNPQPSPADAYNKAYREAAERKRQQERDDLFRQAVESRSAAAQRPVETAARGMTADDVRLLLQAVEQCQKDNGKPLKEGWRDRPNAEQRDYQMVCLAYTLGKSHGQPKP